jgi:RNA-binding protein YlmH
MYIVYRTQYINPSLDRIQSYVLFLREISLQSAGHYTRTHCSVITVVPATRQNLTISPSEIYVNNNAV